MTLAPILTAEPVIQAHLVLALIALIIGPIALWRERRDRLHKVLGYLWVLCFGAAALISFAIPSTFRAFGLAITPLQLGPIHILSVYGLWGLWVAMAAIFQGRVHTHRLVMQNLYIRGLALAGAVNLLPGRTSARALIPDAPMLGYVVIALVALWAFAPLVRTRRIAQEAG